MIKSLFRKSLSSAYWESLNWWRAVSGVLYKEPANRRLAIEVHVAIIRLGSIVLFTYRPRMFKETL